MAQTEFERGFVAGANWMLRETINRIVNVDIEVPFITASKEAEK